MAEKKKKETSKSSKKDKKETKKLSADQKKVLETVEKMSVLELSQLVKALEEKFGVSAAAPVAAVAAPAGGEEKKDEEEKVIFNVMLKDAGSSKIPVIKVIKAAIGVGLKEAKELVDAAPKVVKEGMKKEEAEELKKQLEEAGATVELE